MIIHDCAQGELEWLKLRAGKVTASEMDALISPTFQIRKGDGVHTFLCRKVAEAIHGPLLGFSSWSTEQGQELEDEARRWYKFEFNEKLHNVGFIEGDDHRCGCSPDALIGEDGGVEIKCPEPTNHVRYLLDGILPKDYAAHVHMSMFVTGRPWWRFISYRRKFDPFVLTVHRDEEICAKIQEALTGFYEKYDTAIEKVRPSK